MKVKSACEYSCLTSGSSWVPREKPSAIRDEKSHADDVNLPRIASEWLLYSISCIISTIIVVWVNMADSVNRELTVDVFNHCVNCLSVAWILGKWRHQYGIFLLESQTLLLGDNNNGFPRQQCWAECYLKLIISHPLCIPMFRQNMHYLPALEEALEGHLKLVWRQNTMAIFWCIRAKEKKGRVFTGKLACGN